MKKLFESYNESKVNESKEVDTVMDKVIYLSAEDMEDFFLLLSRYFENKKEELNNMDAVAISKSLMNAYKIIKKRKSN